MSYEEKATILDWTKIGAVILGQFAAVVAFAFILKADVDYLKRDVGELRIDMKQVSRSAEQFEAEAKIIETINQRVTSNTDRIQRLEGLFLPGQAKGPR